MADKGEAVFNIFMLVVGIVIGVFLMHAFCNTYKIGQIDALNGIIKYELVTQEDKTTIWVRTNNNERE